MDEKLQAKLAKMFQIATRALAKRGEIILFLRLLNEFSDEELDLLDEISDKYSFEERRSNDD